MWLLKALGIESGSSGQMWISRTRAAHSHLNYFQNEVDIVHKIILKSIRGIL